LAAAVLTKKIVSVLRLASLVGRAENHVAWFHRRATQQLVAGERGIAPFSTSFIRRGLNAARPRHLNSDVRLLSWFMSLLPKKKGDWSSLVTCIIATVPFAYLLQLGLSYVIGFPYYLSDAVRGREFMLWLNTSPIAFVACYLLTWLLLFIYIKSSSER
jgi:hypothetical protein